MAISANSKILASDITTMTGASSSANGKAGFVPAPAKGKQTSFLRGDGTWVVPTNTTYSAGTGLSLSSNKFSLATVVTAGTIGGNSNATLNFSSTFTTPYVTYDAYGRITGGGTRTLTMPSAPSSTTTASKATAIASTSFVAVRDGYSGEAANYGGGTVAYSSNVAKYTFPTGGTWRYLLQSNAYSLTVHEIAGGKTISFANTHHEHGYDGVIFGFRYV